MPRCSSDPRARGRAAARAPQRARRGRPRWWRRRLQGCTRSAAARRAVSSTSDRTSVARRSRAALSPRRALASAPRPGRVAVWLELARTKWRAERAGRHRGRRPRLRGRWGAGCRRRRPLDRPLPTPRTRAAPTSPRGPPLGPPLCPRPRSRPPRGSSGRARRARRSASGARDPGSRACAAPPPRAAIRRMTSATSSSRAQGRIRAAAC